MTDLFQKKDSLEEMVLSGFFDSIGLYTQPSILQKKTVSQWLELVRLNHLKNIPFKTLSIGQQRLALIVRAVLKHPPLLILDEAVEGLDDENVAMIAQLLALLSQQTNIAILYVSHRIEPNIIPNAIFELIPTAKGSVGILKN
jgi:molybdate transport system ATP-binding protein